jgi:tRNA wybutosine-synthesizing protein 2
MRVLCWEINPWSVEGLRRGALQNGWKVKVIQGQELKLPVDELLVGDEQIVVFIEDNQRALERTANFRECLGQLEILHVNGGLLPTSKDTWEESWRMSCPSTECWLHLHENVGEDDIEKRRAEVGHMFNRWAQDDGNEREAVVEHIERVKTIAPRVWHCVFDVYITKVSLSKES